MRAILVTSLKLDYINIMKKIICTNTTAAYEIVRPIVYPLFKEYARKVGADFVAIEETSNPDNPVMDKFKIGDFLDDYDRLIYLDADLVIRSDMPDLFQIVPPDRFGAYDESASYGSVTMFPRYGEGPMWERIYHMVEMCKAWNLPIPTSIAKVCGEWKGEETNCTNIDKIRYFNAGVFVCSKEHKPLISTELKPLPLSIKTPEQTYMNWAILHHETKMHHLPVCFNQMMHNRVKDFVECSYVVHFAGFELECKPSMMNAVLAIWKEIGY